MKIVLVVIHLILYFENGAAYKFSKNGWGQNYFNKNPSRKCLDPSELRLADNIDASFIHKRRIWYITGSSTYGYKGLANVLLGRPVKDQHELNFMCPERTYCDTLSKASTVNTTGYGVTFQLNCVPVNGTYGAADCVIDPNPALFDGKFNVNPFLITGTIRFYLLKTDNKNYHIWYFCNNGYADIELKTTKPYVSPETAKIFKNVIVELNINPNDIQLLPCSSPGFTNYPYPLQNYPHAHTAGGGGWKNSKLTNSHEDEKTNPYLYL